MLVASSTCSRRPALRHQQQQGGKRRRRGGVCATGAAAADDEATPPPPGRARSVSVRPARPEDVGAIARLERACAPLSAGWTERQVEEELSRDIAVALVAVVSDEKEEREDGAATAATAPDAAAAAVVAGWTAAWRVAGEMQVLAVAVDPSRRRAGLGRALIEALLALAAAEEEEAEERRRGANDNAAAAAAVAPPPLATLELRADNAAAASLYASCGFVEVGRRKGYYDGGKVDALLLERKRGG